VKIVDESNPIPKYIQISTWLKELIEAGRYQRGEQLPSEVELAKMCEVTRATVRQAISELTAIGLLRKEKGTGTFVAEPAPVTLRHKLERIASFGEILSDSGVAEKTIVLNKSVENASAEIASALLLGDNARVIVVKRVRSGNGIPFIYEESHLPYDIFKDILNLDLTGSMYKIISEHFNIVLARCKQTISAVNLEEKIARILKLPTRSAAIFLESLTFDENSMPVEMLYSYHRGDKYKLEIELGRYHKKSDQISFIAES